MENIINNNIRNFVIISHIDHGKSTLADRFLEITKTIPEGKMKPQYLDLMDLERERGITIKMQPVRMIYHSEIKKLGSEFILNLIDTPGHADFSYEVSRSLAAVEGAVLLVDASKGIQAQTISNLQLAQKQNLKIIPVINKIDLPQANIKKVEKEIFNLLKIGPEEIVKISAKNGINVKNLLDEIIVKIPPPKIDFNSPFRALIFDSKYNSYKGIIAFVRVFEGEIKTGDQIKFFRTKFESKVRETGIFNPNFESKDSLKSGEIGYIATGLKDPKKVKIGDTIVKELEGENQKLNFGNKKIIPFPGYEEPKPMVFASIYPEKTDNFKFLEESLEKLKLNDSSLVFKPETREGLGRGFRLGFLGLLHAEIVVERLKREFGLGLILTTPSVVYKINLNDGKEILIDNPADYPPLEKIKKTEELWVNLNILSPASYLGLILKLFEKFDLTNLTTSYLGEDKIKINCQMPLREIVTDNFYDNLKSISSGFASMSYKILEWRESNLVKMDILIAGKIENAFSVIISKERSYQEAKRIVEKLKNILPRQLFAVPIQAVIGGKIIKRETLKATRKDVTAPLYGGDFSRKKKLLEKQKKGKKKLSQIGKINITPQVFLKMFKKEE